MRKWYLIRILFSLIVVAVITNPSDKQYLEFSMELYGEPPQSVKIEVERINFLLFSTYTPIVHYEHGITHIGAFGKFFQLSEGQFDYPMWLNLFNQRGSF